MKGYNIAGGSSGTPTEAFAENREAFPNVHKA